MKIELLVHNLSHSDFVLDVLPVDEGWDSSPSPTTGLTTYVARPRFSEVNQVSECIYNRINKQSINLEKSEPKCHRGQPSTLALTVAVGFSVQECNLHYETARMRIRELLPTNSRSVELRNVFFPLLATLIPKWLNTVDEHARKVVVLVSGRGKPIDELAKEADNSTEYTAKLAKLFLEAAYGNRLEIQLLHSDTNLFRYDENIVFVKRDLLPCVNSYRDELVKIHRGKWKEFLQVTLSFADGTSARVNAINASLRHFRPSYMHFWVVKSFWRSRQIFEDDVECHLFEEVATEPAIPSQEADDPHVRQVVDEMEKFRTEVIGIFSQGRKHDLDSFWLRKTKKPVLSVLLVEKDGESKLYRGSNMEVSMPTGSLCAERNVIGSALAADLTLMREDIKVIAVYSVNMTDISRREQDLTTLIELPTCPPCDSPCFSPSTSSESKNGTIGVHRRKIMRMTSESDHSNIDTNPPMVTSVSGFQNRTARKKTVPFASPSSHVDLSSMDMDGAQQQMNSRLVPTMTTLTVDESDMNPLKPCGACNEWLKKIAEVNPHLKVVTFTDAKCTGIYVEHIAD